jgi:DNA modification methylase
MMLLNKDCLEALKQLPDNSVDAIVTDPPYGLAFMNKKWDYDVPSVEVWKEALRVLKPGGHLLSFGGTRTYHRMAVNIEDAGFEIRDQIQWIYGSGFPKSLNLKDEWEGWGTALKPANEPICLARKPLSEKTVADNVMKWGTGAINIDESRIQSTTKEVNARKQKGGTKAFWNNGSKQTDEWSGVQGRWPANLMFDETAAEILGESSRFFYVAKASKSERNAGLYGFFEQTTNDGRATEIDNPYQRGITKRQNHHPTVKPVKLMEYLCQLVTPPQGVVLDPFMGSGTTGIAAKRLGFDFIGIEKEPEYVEIAEKRINA